MTCLAQISLLGVLQMLPEDSQTDLDERMGKTVNLIFHSTLENVSKRQKISDELEGMGFSQNII